VIEALLLHGLVCSPGAVGLDLDPTDKVFSLHIMVARVVLIENPLDDIASPLGISSNMLIKAAITRNPFLPNIGVCEHARAMKMVSIPRFSRSRNTLPISLRQISSFGQFLKIIYLGFEKSQRSVTHDFLRYINILILLAYLPVKPADCNAVTPRFCLVCQSSTTTIHGRTRNMYTATPRCTHLSRRR